METINTEILVSSLFKVGFDKVDGFLFEFVLAKQTMDNQGSNIFKFKDSMTTDFFNKYVDFNGIVFKLKDGITLDTEVSYNNEKFYPLGEMLNTNKKLIEYLSQLDYSEIVLEKAEMYGEYDINRIDKKIFSQKEIEILIKLQNDYMANTSLWKEMIMTRSENIKFAQLVKKRKPKKEDNK
jgi:hypothetical protein